MKNILYTLRKAKNMTQEEVSNLLQIDRRNYPRLESCEITKVANDKLQILAKLYNVSMDYLFSNGKDAERKGVRIAVLGSIPAGIPVEAVEDIIDFEEIPYQLAMTGEFFGLKVKGNSMSPKISHNDVVIIRRQENAETGDICAVMVNGNEATLKQIKKLDNGIMLIPFNPEYAPMFYSIDDIEKLPIKIIGKVVEARIKF